MSKIGFSKTLPALKNYLVSRCLERDGVLLVDVAGVELCIGLPVQVVVELDPDVVPRDPLTEQDDLLPAGGRARRVRDVHDLQLSLGLQKCLL